MRTAHSRLGARTKIVACVAVTIGSVACSSLVDVGLSDVRVFPDHREVDVGFRSSDGTILSGTLHLPVAEGHYPAAVWHFGSGEWTRTPWEGSQIPRWVGSGVAVLTYDKRGNGRSGGTCCPWRANGYFELLGDDVLAGVRAVSTHPEVDATSVGLFGFSQGGWVVPVAAARGAGEVAFAVIGSGPTVSLGEELLYSELSGENTCTDSGLSDHQIAVALERAGPSGFDPRAYLEQMVAPGLWIYGEEDESLPVPQSIAILDQLIDRGKPFEYTIIEDANHQWILNGGPCVGVGETVDMIPTIVQWVLDRTR